MILPTQQILPKYVPQTTVRMTADDGLFLLPVFSRGLSSATLDCCCMQNHCGDSKILYKFDSDALCSFLSYYNLSILSIWPGIPMGQFSGHLSRHSFSELTQFIGPNCVQFEKKRILS